jgi:hypothetical protein
MSALGVTLSRIAAQYSPVVHERPAEGVIGEATNRSFAAGRAR